MSIEFMRLCPSLKQSLDDCKVKDDSEVETTETRRLVRKESEAEKLVPRYDKLVSHGGDYVEIQRDSSVLSFEIKL